MSSEITTTLLWIVGIAVMVGGIGGVVLFQAVRRKPSGPPAAQAPYPQPNLQQQETLSTMIASDPTISLLPPFLVVLAGADEPPGARKVLVMQGGESRFEIERETDPPGQERLWPNRIRIRSVFVARSGQGFIQYDGTRNQCYIHNQADRKDQRNPIVVGNRMLEPNEAALLEDGVEIRIGKVRLQYHAHEKGQGLTGTWS